MVQVVREDCLTRTCGDRCKHICCVHMYRTRVCLYFLTHLICKSAERSADSAGIKQAQDYVLECLEFLKIKFWVPLAASLHLVIVSEHYFAMTTCGVRSSDLWSYEPL